MAEADQAQAQAGSAEDLGAPPAAAEEEEASAEEAAAFPSGGRSPGDPPFPSGPRSLAPAPAASAPPGEPFQPRVPFAGGSAAAEGEQEDEENEEEEEENAAAAASEATSVSSGDSGPPTPSANGFPGPRGGKEPRGTAGEPLDGGGREGGHERLSATHAPSPEWHECPECGRGFGTSRALKVHRSYHVGRKRPHSGSSAAKPPAPLSPLVLPGNPPESQDGRTAPGGRGRAFHYICAECGLGFASPATLEGHRCEHGWRRSPPAPPAPRHKPAPSPAAPPEANGEQDADGADGPYRCTECSGKFGLVSELHEHYIRHARGEL